MGELKYTLFYMGFVLKEEKKNKPTKPATCGKSSQWTWAQGYGSPSQNADQGSLRTQEQHPYLQSCWVPASPTARWVARSQRKHSHQDSAGEAGIILTAPPSSGAHGTGLCGWPRFRTHPFPFPSWLPFTFSQVYWKATITGTHASIRLWTSMSGTCLPWGDSF